MATVVLATKSLYIGILIMTLLANVSESTSAITLEFMASINEEPSTVETLTTLVITTDLPTTEMSTTEKSTTEPSTTKKSTTEPLTTEKSTTESLTMRKSTTEPSKTEPLTIEESLTTFIPLTTELPIMKPSTSAQQITETSTTKSHKTTETSMKQTKKMEETSRRVRIIESTIKDGYRKSFLNEAVKVTCTMKDESCEESCGFQCEVDAAKMHSETVMVAALANGITTTGVDYIDFMSLSIVSEEEECEEKKLILIVVTACLSILVVVLICFIVKMVIKKRNRRVKSRKADTKRMKKMTFRRQVQSWLYSKKESDQNTTVTENNYKENDAYVKQGTSNNSYSPDDNDGTSMELLEDVVEKAHDKDYDNIKITEKKEINDAPIPVGRPKETLPAPNPNNPYLDMRQQHNDPIYVNKIVGDMRSGKV